MKIRIATTAILATALTVGFATASMSDGHSEKQAKAAIKARKAAMQLYSFNLGLLGDMAKGAVEYDADAAKAAAANLAAVTSLDQSRFWPQGSDSDTMTGETRALPAIWQPGSKAGEIGGKLSQAAATMATAAGTGVDGIRGAIGPIGGACKACHDDYRQPR